VLLFECKGKKKSGSTFGISNFKKKTFFEKQPLLEIRRLAASLNSREELRH
jgi:hypothetical protein